MAALLRLLPRGGLGGLGWQRTEGVDRIRQRNLTVLLVGVVRTGPRIVTEPDAKVFDLLWGLLEDLRDAVCGVRHERAV